MNKEQKKKLRAQVRNSLEKQYKYNLELTNKRIEYYEQEMKRYRQRFYESKNYCAKLERDVRDLTNKNLHLQDKVRQQADWIERLIEFVNMPADMREKELEAMRRRQENEKNKKRIYDSPLFQLFDMYFC